MTSVQRTLRLLGCAAALGVSLAQAYTITIPVDVAVTQLSDNVTSVQVGCTLTFSGGAEHGRNSAPVSNRAVFGAINVAIEASQPVNRYEDVTCELSLCRGAQCDTPIPHSEAAGPNSLKIAYDDERQYLISHRQPVIDSIMFETMAPPSAIARTNARSDSKPKTLSGGTPSSGKTAKIASPQLAKESIKQNESGTNSQADAVMQRLFDLYDLSSAEEAYIGSDRSKLKEILSIRGTSESMGNDEKTQERAVAEFIKGGGTKDARNRANLIIISIYAGDADEKELIDSGLEASEVMKLVGTAEQMGLNDDQLSDVVDEAVKDGNTDGALVSVVSEGTGMDIEQARKYGDARKAMEAFVFVRQMGIEDDALSDPEFTDAYSGYQKGEVSKNEMLGKLVDSGFVTEQVAGDLGGSGVDGGTGNNQQTGDTGGGAGRDTRAATGARVVGTGIGKEVTIVQTGKRPVGGGGSGPGAGSGGGAGGSTPAKTPADQGKNEDLNANDLERIDGGSFDEAPPQDEEQGPTYISIDSRSENQQSGTVTVTYTITAPDGTQTTRVVEHRADGTMKVTDENGNVIYEGKDDQGAPPEGSEGSTGIVDDETGEATFVEEDDGDEEGGEGCEESGDCGNNDEEGSAEEATAESPESETEADSTPDPRDRDNMSEGIAWAMSNPDNPLAQQILATAAQSVQELSGACQAGCPEATSEGGILWAMMNPKNPLAQQILANAAEAIQNNSGDGQSGGPDDNPANQPVGGQVSDADLRRIELLISGGGVSDPPEEAGGGVPPDAGNGLGGASPVVGGTGPLNSVDLEVRQTMSDDGSDDSQGGNGDVDAQVDTGRLNSGGLR